MLLNFAFLFALIWLFDRKRDDLDAFTIATAVVVPGIIVFLFRLIRMFFEWGLWGEFAELGILVTATFLVLKITLGFNALKAAAYSIAILLFNFAVAFGLSML